MWTNTAGLKGLGGYYRADSEVCRRGTAYSNLETVWPEEEYMVALPSHIALRREHINTKEMRAVEQGILRWGNSWREA